MPYTIQLLNVCVGGCDDMLRNGDMTEHKPNLIFHMQLSVRECARVRFWSNDIFKPM